MKDHSKLKDYRKKYKRHYGVEFGKEFVVHHIDGDRSNNDIENLMLMPRDIHSEYHMAKSQVENMGSVILDTKLGSRYDQMRSMELFYIERFLSVLEKTDEWVYRKEMADRGFDSYKDFRKE